MTLPSLATSGYEAALSAAVSEAKSGDTVTVAVGLSGDVGISFATAELNIRYDSTMLRFDSIEPQPWSVTASGGTIRIVDCGGDKFLGTKAYQLHFTAIKKGNAEVELTSARLGTRQTAATENLRAATITMAKYAITISPKPTYSVALSEEEYTSGASTVEEGEEYTLSVEEYDKYDYEVTATMAGDSVKVIDRGNGKFVVENVTGELVFSVKRTKKTTPTSMPTPTSNPTSQPMPQDKADGSAPTKTGDAAMPLLWLTLCVVCSVAVMVTTRSKREKTPDPN